jgi:hypothetical protein
VVVSGLSFPTALVLALSATCCVLWWSPSVQAQRSEPRLRIYLDCGRTCEDEYYRQTLNYFDWVRDRYEADLMITIVEQTASNGGNSYTLTVRQPREPFRARIVRTVTTHPGDPPAVEREKLLKAALSALLEALRGTAHEDDFTIALPRRDGESLREVRDGWDYWVFAPEIAAEVEGESNFYFMELLALLNVRRVTEASKFGSVTRFSRRSVSYVLEDEERVSGHTNSLSQRFTYAHSIGPHWALGAIAVARRSQYENLELQLHGGPALEWSLFPYEENASRQLRFVYQIGPWYSRYFELTVFDRLEELRPYHALSAIVDFNQAWGSVQTAIQGNAFLDEPKRWRLAASLVLSLSLVAGLALQFEGEIAWIHDQIGLRARDLSDEEIFLETRELEKTVSYVATFGFSYTFGSVHNTIVNPRFGRVDLEQD